MEDLGLPGVNDAPMLLRELHHRVKNNFQIIASLINLKRRTTVAECQDDMRFLQEHVMVMAAAHRLVYATSGMMEVHLTDLVVEVSEGLREIAGAPSPLLAVQAPGVTRGVALDQAIGIGLYLAISLPPYLDRARRTGSRVTVEIAQNPLSLSIIPEAGGTIELDTLRQRLMTAYVRHLAATTRAAGADGGSALHFASSC